MRHDLGVPASPTEPEEVSALDPPKGLSMTNIAKPTANFAAPLICDKCSKPIDVKPGQSYVGSTDGRVWHYGCSPRSSAPQEPDALRRLVEESLYHLRLDDRAKDYHERALAALEGKTLASKGRCHCGFWPCPTHQIDDISERPAEAQEPVADDAESLARLFHETYERLAPQFSYETRKASAVPWEKVPENNRNLMVAVAGVVLDRLQAKAPETGEG